MSSESRPAGAMWAGLRRLVTLPLVLVLLALGLQPSCRRSEEDIGRATSPPRPDREIQQGVEPHRPLVLVGLDGADWQFLDRLIADGVMPNLAALRRRAVWGTLHSEEPMLSPLLWTTMMTGVSPLEHRILDFTRHNPVTGRQELITSSERRRPALWNMATAAGLEVAVFGIWATWPAEPVRGTLVSDRLFSFLYGEEDPPSQLAFPAGAEQRALDVLDVVEADVELDRLQEYLPWLDRTRYEAVLAAEDPYADPVGALRRVLIQTEVYSRLALEPLRDSTPPELTVLYLEGTDAIGHLFAPHLPPPLPEVSAAESARFRDVPQRFYGDVDRLLGELWALVDSVGANLLIVSDHGFRWQDRPRSLGGDRAATAALWHREEGIYLLAGEEVEGRRSRSDAGGIRQIAATALALLGMPPGEGMSGPTLPGVDPFPGPAVGYRAHYQRPSEPIRIASESAPDLDRLRALGYLGDSADSARPESSVGTMTASALNNEGRLLQQEGRLEEAKARFHQALEMAPEHAETLTNLGILLAEGGETEQAIAVLARAAAADSEAIQVRVNLARVLSLSGRWDEAVEQYEAALAHYPEDLSLRAFRAEALLESGRSTEAAAAFGELAEERPERALFWVREAQALALAGRPDRARRRLETALQRLPRSGEIGHALARLLLSTPTASEQDALRALDLAQGAFDARPTLEHGETLAVALAATGRHDKARALTRRLLSQARSEAGADDQLIARLETLLARLG